MPGLLVKTEPNHRLQPTPSSVRCAPASGSRGAPAFGFKCHRSGRAVYPG